MLLSREEKEDEPNRAYDETELCAPVYNTCPPKSEKILKQLK